MSNPSNPHSLLSATLAGACFVCVVQLAATPPAHPGWQYFAVSGFSIAIPLLALSFLSPPEPTLHSKRPHGRVQTSVYLLGCLVAIVSIGLLITSLSSVAGTLFTISAIAATIVGWTKPSV